MVVLCSAESFSGLWVAFSHVLEQKNAENLFVHSCYPWASTTGKKHYSDCILCNDIRNMHITEHQIWETDRKPPCSILPLKEQIYRGSFIDPAVPRCSIWLTRNVSLPCWLFSAGAFRGRLIPLSQGPPQGWHGRVHQYGVVKLELFISSKTNEGLNVYMCMYVSIDGRQ